MSLDTRPLFTLTVEAAAPHVIEAGPCGTRRFVPVTGGSFSGQRLAGRVLPGGADCQLVRPDGVAELDVRVSLQTDDGVVLLMKGFGLRHGPAEVLQRLARREEVDPALYYFRQTAWFEAPPGRHAWLNRVVAVGRGERRPGHIVIHFDEIL